MIHLVRSVSIADSSSNSSDSSDCSETSIPKRASVVRLEPKAVATRQTADDPEEDGKVIEGHGEMAHRGLVVLENLLYPVETQPAIAPTQMSLSMEELYQCLTVQQVAVNRPGLNPTVLEEVNKLTAETKFVQDYPQQFLQAPSIPVRSKSMLPPLPFLEVGSGLLAFTIVSGVVVADGLKQARTMPSTIKRAEPITSPRDRANRAAQVSAAMSDMETLRSGRTLPMPKNAGVGLGSGLGNLTPEQMSQLALQQAIAASKVGQPISPPANVIPSLTTFAPAPTGPVNDPNPVPQQPAPPQAPISMTPPPQRQSDRQPQRLPAPPAAREPIAPPRQPVPQRPEGSESQFIPAPSPMPTPAPIATPGSPVIRQSMMPVPADSPVVDNMPRPVTAPKDESPVRSEETVSTLKMTPRVLSSMRPSASDLVLPAAPIAPEQPKIVAPEVQPTVESRDLVFKREVL